MSDKSDTQKRVIAIPSQAPGGLGAQRSGHFGHCDYFTLVNVIDDTVANASVVENIPHHEGGCLEPVRLLANLGVTEIVVGGMGAGPLTFFGEMGITVYADQELPTVKEVVDALLLDRVPVMSPMQVCGGGSCH